MTKPKTVIVGSGLMGLTLGRLIPDSLILEESTDAGGLFRTFHEKGFHLDPCFQYIARLDLEVEEFIRSNLGIELSKITLRHESRGLLRDGLFLHGITGPHHVASQLNPCLRIPFLWSHGLRRMFPKRGANYEDFAINHYGDLYYRFLIRRFVQKYSRISPRKLFVPGLPQSHPQLSLRSLLGGIRKANYSAAAQPNWEWFYPLPWMGRIAEELTRGLEIRYSAKLTHVCFSGRRAVEVEINGRETIPCHAIFLTAPPTHDLAAFAPPPEILDRAAQIRYRNLISPALFFQTPHVTKEMILLGMGKEIFAQAWEPKKWSSAMAAVDRTAVCFEIYCLEEEPVWKATDEELVRHVLKDFRRYYPAPDPYDSLVLRTRRFSPVTDGRFEANTGSVHQFLSSFENVYAPGIESIANGRDANLAIGEAFRLLDRGGLLPLLGEARKNRRDSRGASPEPAESLRPLHQTAAAAPPAAQ